ncbi:MAG: hypothetical protein Q9227_006818 [Pyrenula ochraceoflavens]
MHSLYAIGRLLPRLSRHSISPGPVCLASSSRPLRRCYYSEQYPAKAPYSSAEDAILSAALVHVPRFGFSSRALILGAADAGYPEVSTQLFPHGVFDLIRYYLVTQRLALKNRVRFPEDADLRVGGKIRTLTLERLRANKDVIYQWQGALGHMSLLGNIPASLSELHSLSDEIWYLAGDKSVDSSWYTKRASLAAIYASSELFMTTDTSKDFAETEAFLDRRLEDVQKLGKATSGVGQFVGFWAGSTVNLARSWGLRV